ncbi:MAG: DNA repair protein [Pseudomonadota bacterium]|nr:DNA repair protein [Pseudomonadota bacterium]
MASVLTSIPETRHIFGLEGALAVFAHLGGLRHEMIAFAYLDPDRRLLALRHAQVGDVEAAEVPVRLVMADVLAFDAEGVIMAHNHPGGDPAPSEADRAATRRLARVLNAVEVRLLDHIVLTRDDASSFRAMGLL